MLSITKQCFALLLLLTFVFTGCNTDDPVTPEAPLPTLAEIAAGNTDFEVLLAAAVHAGLDDELASSTLTVFAPTDAAFVSWLSATDEADAISTIQGLPSADVAAILQYHLVGDFVLAADLSTGAVNTLRATGTPAIDGRVFVSVDGSDVRVNNVAVTQADVAGRNGVIHIIDAVLEEPTDDIVDVAVAGSGFDVLEAAVIHANLVTALQGAGPLTVFAPTDAAFVAFTGQTNEADAITFLQGLPSGDVADILLYHVVSGAVFSSDLSAGAVSTLNTNVDLTIDLMSGVSVTAGDNTASVVTTTDGATFNVLTTNGVIHVIDEVIDTP